MKARYMNDTGKGPGNGFLQISDLADMGDLEGARCGIKRASDQKSLGQSGWQPAETYLPVSGVSLTDDGFALAVGPDVVDRLDPLETYRLTLAFTDGKTASGMLSVPEVAYSPQAGGQGIGATEKKTAAPPPPPPPPTPMPAPEPMPEPAPAPEPEPLPPPIPQPKKSSSLPIILGILILLLAGGGFAVWKFVLNKDETPVAEAPPPKAALARAREHLADKADPAESLNLAKELRELKDGADAAFLLAEDAAQKGLAEAMLMSGSFYDPAAKEAAGSIQKDANEALAWYTKAKEAGSAEADKRLAELRAWAEAEKAKGSKEAEELLNKMQ